MNPQAVIGISLGVIAYIGFLAAEVIAKRRRITAIAEAAAKRVAAEAESKAAKHRKVVLPTASESILEADPVIEWQEIELDGAVAYMNPVTGEIVQSGLTQKKNSV